MVISKQMVTGRQIVKEARTYIDTPFHHQGRLKGIGIDCVGLLTCVASALGITDYDNTSYSRDPDGVTLMQELQKIADEIDMQNAGVGDILVFWISSKSKKPQHLAIKTEKGMIHTYAHIKKVVEHSLGSMWTKRLVAAFRLKGVA